MNPWKKCACLVSDCASRTSFPADSSSEGASALSVKQPAVLLLDEPLGALDLKLRKNMQYELKALQRDVGITFIYVTHDQEEAITMADRIAVMNEGRCYRLAHPKKSTSIPAPTL